jgi:hypothetical protein
MPQGPRQCITVYKVGKRAGLRCGWRATKGSVHCAKHTKGAPPPETMQAMRQGNKTWWQRIRAAKDEGFISCLPQHPQTPEHKERLRQNAARAREVKLARREAAKALLPDPPPKRKPGRPKGIPMTDEQKELRREQRNAREREKGMAKRAARRPLLDARRALTDEMKAGHIEAVAAHEATIPRPILKATKVLMREKEMLPTLPDKPFEEMEPHEKLTAITGLALDYAHQLLLMEVDPLEDRKTAELKWKAATGALSLRVKVDRNELASRKVNGVMGLLERLRGEKQVNGTVIEG